MHYCGVIASAKDLANIHQAHTGHFASQIHGDLTRNSHVFFWFVITDKILKRQVEVLRHLTDDVRGLDFHIGGEEVLQRLLGQGAGHRLITQRGHGRNTG